MYIVLDYHFGNYTYDTLEIEGKDKIIYQIPIKKGLESIIIPDIIGKKVKIENLYSPIKKDIFKSI